MGHTVQFLVQHGYALLFLWVLAEQAALPLPSIPLLLACGALARTGQLDLRLILFYGLAACLIADNVWFQLGRHRGTKILRLICRISIEPDSCVRQTENTFLKYGLSSLLVAKFIPGLNAVAAPLAGVSRASLRRFLIFDSLGALSWIGAYVCAGYIFSNQLEDVGAYAMRMGSGLILLIAALLGAWIGWKYVQRRRFLRKLAVARITPEELRDRLAAGEEVLIVDLRSGLADDADTIPGAIRMSTEDLAARYAEIPRDREVVLFCS
jgi:membrane protein DedA with SNARE-associated domain